MTTEIVPRSGGTALTKRELAASRLYPNIKTPEQAAVVLKKAESYGLCPTTVADGLFFVGGKPSLSAQLIATLLMRSGRYTYRVKTKADKLCEIEFFAVQGDGSKESLGVESFTWAMATRAGLASGVNWKKYPEAMLFARCLTAGVRARCPDALGGNPVYSVEELSPTTEVDSEGRPMLAATDVQDAEVVEPTEQHEQIERLLAETQTDRERFLTHYGAASITHLDADACTQAIGTLTAKKQAQAL